MPPSLSCSELPTSTIAGQETRRFLLRSPQMSVELMEFGATVLSVHLKSPGGESCCVTRGLPDAESYRHNPAYMGSTCGRFAGRIANARLTRLGREVQLAANNGAHQLHGGVIGFNARLWVATPFERSDRVGVEFSYFSPDGEEGYPGALDCQVIYSLDNAGRLRIDYEARVLSEPTVVNLTNHCYWNFSDEASVMGHEVTLAAQSALVFDDDLLPTGESLPVAGSGLDFTRPRLVGEAMAQLSESAAGFDHCFHDFASIPQQEGARQADDKNTIDLPQVARVADPVSGRGMRVYTDQPALVFYTGNALDGSAGVGGHGRHSALCLECQQFPDAPNQPNFPSTLVGPERAYQQHSVFEFFVRDNP